MQIISVIFLNLLFFIDKPISLAKSLEEINFLNECKQKFTLKYELFSIEVWTLHFPSALTVCIHREIYSCFHSDNAV